MMSGTRVSRDVAVVESDENWLSRLARIKIQIWDGHILHVVLKWTLSTQKMHDFADFLCSLFLCSCHPISKQWRKQQCELSQSGWMIYNQLRQKFILVIANAASDKNCLYKKVGGI